MHEKPIEVKYYVGPQQFNSDEEAKAYQLIQTEKDIETIKSKISELTDKLVEYKIFLEKLKSA